jgi:hypothetical protein
LVTTSSQPLLDSELTVFIHDFNFSRTILLKSKLVSGEEWCGESRTGVMRAIGERRGMALTRDGRTRAHRQYAESVQSTLAITLVVYDVDESELKGI